MRLSAQESDNLGETNIGDKADKADPAWSPASLVDLQTTFSLARSSVASHFLLAHSK